MSYIDSAGVLLDRKPSNGELVELRQASGAITFHRSKNPQWWKLVVHQPSSDSLLLLEKLAEHKNAIPNEIHVAIDFVTETVEESRELGDWFNRHVVKRWHGKQKIGTYKGTRYTSQRRWNVNQIATYSDRPSKVSGVPCLHVEWRSKGRQPVKRSGIEVVSDIRRLNLRDYWHGRLVFERPRVAVIGRMVCGKRGEKARRQGGALMRHAMYAAGEEQVTAQAVRDLCRQWPRFRADRAMERLDVKFAVAPGTNDYPSKLPRFRSNRINNVPNTTHTNEKSQGEENQQHFVTTIRSYEFQKDKERKLNNESTLTQPTTPTK